ncbi:MAG: hypothetical protein H7Y86_20635 [Rhizobacter sp.]|nr:hypothetical protein [Ferruginibacter sp.]
MYAYFCNNVTITLISHKNIRPVFALFMMMVMAFSITPKRTVHELFGCHDKTIATYKHNKQGEPDFNKDGFHCACEQQEFQTPFISSIAPPFSAPDFSFNKPTNVGNIISYHSTLRQLQPLRGPPALV